MKIFALGFYDPDDQRQDLVAIVCDHDLEGAAQTAERELEPAITGKYRAFASVALLLGENQEFKEPALLAGPLYGDFYNRAELPIWTRDDHGSPWMLVK